MDVFLSKFPLGGDLLINAIVNLYIHVCIFKAIFIRNCCFWDHFLVIFVIHILPMMLRTCTFEDFLLQYRCYMIQNVVLKLEYYFLEPGY